MRLPRPRPIAPWRDGTRGKTPISTGYSRSRFWRSRDTPGAIRVTAHLSIYAALRERDPVGILPARLVRFRPGHPGSAPIARATTARPARTAPRGGTVSSAILFAAIVVIWIGVLVPRWLRHEHAHDGQLRLRPFSRQPAADRQDGDTNARTGFSQAGPPRYASFGDHGDPREDHTKAGRAGRDRSTVPSGHNSLSQNYDGAYVPAARNGNAGDMAQLYETDEAPAPVRSYGWSADEYLRHEREHLRRERTRQRAPHDGRHPVERQEQSGGGRRKPPQHDERPQYGGRSDSGLDDEEQRPGHRGRLPAENRATADSERRARMVRGRRRMLWMLITLTAAAAGLAYLRLAAWWIVIPPVALLGGYLLVLREAARADAEARELLAVQARHAREAEARREAEAEAEAEAKAEAEAAPGRTTGTSVPTGLVWDSAETDPHAEIIDISERVGDELYDQYADAKLRAVGD